MRNRSFLGLSALAAFGLLVSMVTAADKPLEQTAKDDQVLKSSTIVGMKVMNSKNETVGKIEDLAVDPRSGEIRYAALGVGGFLGIGEKMFPVPWEKLTLKHEGKDSYFFFDVDKERLKDAPGFSKTDWPFADPKFANSIDQFYSVRRVARPIDRDTAPPKR